MGRTGSSGTFSCGGELVPAAGPRPAHDIDGGSSLGPVDTPSVEACLEGRSGWQPPYRPH
jgi:hypothetical protein